MRHGLFCRACRRTRSQIEATGENWQAHLNANSQGRAVGTTPEEIRAKEQEFEGNINNTKAEEYHANLEAAASARAQADAAQQVQNSLALWKQAMLVEDDGRAKAWDSAIGNFKERLTLEFRIESLFARGVSVRPNARIVFDLFLDHCVEDDRDFMGGRRRGSHWS